MRKKPILLGFPRDKNPLQRAIFDLQPVRLRFSHESPTITGLDTRQLSDEIGASYAELVPTTLYGMRLDYESSPQ